MLAEPNHVSIAFISPLMRNERGDRTGFQGLTSSRFCDSGPPLAVTFSHVEISRRRPSECLATIAGRKQEVSDARRRELPGSLNRKAKTKADRFSIRWKRFAGP